MARAGRFEGLWVGLIIVTTVACSIAIRRDLSAVPAGQVGFDDMCGLQEYFDALEIKTSPPPRVVSALDLEGQSGGKRVTGGVERFAFENDFQLKHLRRVLNENWRRLPESVAAAPKIEIEVKWSEKAGSKRVVTDHPAELAVGAETFALPYHVCLSELLYGESLYRQRRVMWGLPLPGMPPGKAPPDAGAAAVDGGAAAKDGSADGRRPDAS
jgi:hypothetical protein